MGFPLFVVHVPGLSGSGTKSWSASLYNGQLANFNDDDDNDFSLASVFDNEPELYFLSTVQDDRNKHPAPSSCYTYLTAANFKGKHSTVRSTHYLRSFSYFLYKPNSKCFTQLLRCCCRLCYDVCVGYVVGSVVDDSTTQLNPLPCFLLAFLSSAIINKPVPFFLIVIWLFTFRVFRSILQTAAKLALKLLKSIVKTRDWKGMKMYRLFKNPRKVLVQVKRLP